MRERLDILKNPFAAVSQWQCNVLEVKGQGVSLTLFALNILLKKSARCNAEEHEVEELYSARDRRMAGLSMLTEMPQVLDLRQIWFTNLLLLGFDPVSQEDKTKVRFSRCAHWRML